MKPGGLFPSAQSEAQSDSKKHKKKKKKSKRRRSSSSSSSSDGDQWVEKPSSSAATAPSPSVVHGQDKPSSSAVEPPAAPKRDAWMEVENIFSGVTAGEVRDRRRQTKQEAREAEDRQRQADYEARKWRDTPDSSAKPAAKIGDGGASWLRRALQRAKQQAAESGRPLEEIVSERWGSMEKLQSMLDAAEGRKTPAQPDAAAAEKGTRERGWRRDYPDRRRSRSKERRRSRSRDRVRNVSKERKRSRSRSRSKDRRRSRSRSRERKRSRSRSRDRRRSRSRSKERRLDTSRSRERRRATSSKEREERPRERSHRGKERSRSRSVDKKDSDKCSRSPDRRKLDASNNSGRGSSVMADGDKARKEDSASRSGDAATSSKISNTSEYTRHLSPDPQSGSDDDEDGSSTRAEQARPLTDDEMNALAAKILKAELNGDDDDVAELQKQLDAARQLRAAGGGAARTAQKSEKVVIVVGKGERGGPSGGDNRANKKRKADTHRGGERTKYFADDDRLNLRDMFEREKRTTTADEAAALARLAARGVRQNRHHDDDHGLDEQLAERAGRAEPERAQDERTAARARTQHRHMERCTRCFDSRHTLRHLIAALGDKSYLSLPAGRSVTEHHCLIVPLQHAVSLTAVEEDTWEEMMRFRKAVVAMFAAEDDQDVIFFESALKLQTHPHAVLHCVPVPRETGDLAPIYFKKALEESETEWSQNKKVVDLRGRDVRRAVPKGLPYFFVDFGMQPGFAHVVEDEDLFQENFAQEVIGGMLELDPSSWRRSKNETLEQQRKKAMDFAKIWDPHDFTKEG